MKIPVNGKTARFCQDCGGIAYNLATNISIDHESNEVVFLTVAKPICGRCLSFSSMEFKKIE